MSTIKQNPQPQPTPQPEKKGSRLLPFALVAVVALLALAAYLAIQNSGLKDDNANVLAQLDETSMLKRDVEQQYYESLAELEEMRGSNAELNTLIDTQKQELASAKKRIDQLLRDKRNLGQARTELATLKEQTASYVAEIRQLREENALLAEQNANLSNENVGLQQTVAEATSQNDALTAARAELMSEKGVLLEERAELTSKVTMASVVKITNIDVTGLKVKNNGKTVKKRYAKNVDVLNICFQTTENDVTVPGNEEFYVRIVNPLGETLAVEEMGSGVLTNALSKEQVRYTRAAGHQYANSVDEVCLMWDTPYELAKGDYGVEIYNKGYLAGQGAFTLK